MYIKVMNGGTMNQEEKIKALLVELQAEEIKINGLLLAGKIPAKADYAELDRIKNELKAARRVKAMDAKRSDPKLTRKITISLSDDEYQALKRNADKAGVDLSKHIRGLLNN
jgi:predicted DNA binding CopG/RHH family protein